MRGSQRKGAVDKKLEKKFQGDRLALTHFYTGQFLRAVFGGVPPHFNLRGLGLADCQGTCGYSAVMGGVFPLNLFMANY